MPEKKYLVELSNEERTYLAELIAAGVESVRKLRRARILLKADQGEYGPAWTDQRICEAFEVSRITVEKVRKNYIGRGMLGAINRKKTEREYERCLDGEAEAHLIALTCSESPDGYERWTLRLLRDKMIELKYVECVSHETVRKVLKKTNLSLG